MEKFTIDEIRTYLETFGGLDVVMANLSAEGIRKVNPLQTREDVMREFVLGMPQYEEVGHPFEFIKIIKVIKDVIPFYVSNSLHINQDSYLINDEVYTVSSAISGDSDDVTIQRLTNKDDCKHKDTKILHNNQEICTRCAFTIDYTEF